MDNELMDDRACCTCLHSAENEDDCRICEILSREVADDDYCERYSD